MHKFFSATAFCAAAMVGSIAAAGEIEIHNNTGDDIRIKCSYAGSFEVHHGSTRSVNYKSNVHDVSCQAHDHGNRHIESRNFHFEHHNSHHSWNVGHH